jgi:hypothetical protein
MNTTKISETLKKTLVAAGIALTLQALAAQPSLADPQSDARALLSHDSVAGSTTREQASRYIATPDAQEQARRLLSGAGAWQPTAHPALSSRAYSGRGPAHDTTQLARQMILGRQA